MSVQKYTSNVLVLCLYGFQIPSSCLSDLKFSTTPRKSSISSSVLLKMLPDLDFFFVPSSSVNGSDFLLVVAILQLVLLLYVYIACQKNILHFCACQIFARFTFVPKPRWQVPSTEFVLYRHRVNACQSATESCRYHVSGAVFNDTGIV